MPGGFLSSLKKEAGKLGRDVSRGMDSLAKDVNKTVDEHWSSPVLDAFTTGNVLQLISRSSGKALQIVQAASGQLVVDGLGLEGPTAYNAQWRIINHGRNVISLQNQDNFLALQNGMLYIVHIPPGTPAGVETLFRLSQIDKNFVILISKKEDNCRIGVLKDGQLKSPLTTVSEWDAQYAVRVISTQVNPIGPGTRQQQAQSKSTNQPSQATNQPINQPSYQASASTHQPYGVGSLTAASPKEIEALGPRNSTSQNDTSQVDSSQNQRREGPLRPPPPYVVATASAVPPPYPSQVGATDAPPPYPVASSQTQANVPQNPGYHSVPGNPAYPDVAN